MALNPLEQEEYFSFACRLRELRQEAGLSQEQASDLLGIERSTYAYYETGRSVPNLRRLITITHLFHVTLDYLLMGRMPKENDYAGFDSLTGAISLPPFAMKHLNVQAGNKVAVTIHKNWILIRKVLEEDTKKETGEP